MILVDTNLLLYATDKSNQRHGAARAWLESKFADGTGVAFTWVALLGFIRIVTNPRIMPNRFSIADAVNHVSVWLSQPGSQLVGPTTSHWHHLQAMLQAAPQGGNLTTDAHLAALAVEHACELCTADGDFSRFPGLKWRNPLSAAQTGSEPRSAA